MNFSSLKNKLRHNGLNSLKLGNVLDFGLFNIDYISKPSSFLFHSVFTNKALTVLDKGYNHMLRNTPKQQLLIRKHVTKRS